MERKTFRGKLVVRMCILMIFSITLTSFNVYAENDVTQYAYKFYSNSDLTKMTGMTKEEFVIYCKGMKYDYTGFYSRNAEYIYDCCKTYNLNEFTFIGISAWEGGWCRHGVNYNYYGLIGDEYNYSSEKEGIKSFISYFTSNYLSTSGKYYKGRTIKDVNICYNTVDPEWYWHIVECAQSSAKRK